MEPKQVIENILEVYNLNAAEFAEKIDVQRSGVSHIMTGRNKPSLEFLIKIKNTFPDLRWDFLILGKLPMFATDEKKLNKDTGNEISAPQNETKTSPTLFDITDDEVITEEKKAQKISKPFNKTIEKIVLFYNDGTFDSYQENDLK